MAGKGASNTSDDDSTIKVAPKKVAKDKPTGTIKLKKPAPKHSEPGNWQEGRVIDVDEKKSKGRDTPSTNSMDSDGPVVNQLDDSARASFATGRPLEDPLELQICKHCKKSILKSAIGAHLPSCLKAKKEKAQQKKKKKEDREREKKGLGAVENKDDDEDAKGDDDDEDDDDSAEKKSKGAKQSAGKKVAIDESKKGRKRKADGDAEKGPKQKKKKEEPKPKVPKPKGPVDVERQCGVLKDGVPCARSLTCKSHSMGAKRAVPGRSLPYDMLLSQYQKKNQAKQQKAAIDANAPLEDEDAAAGPIDSDEELSAATHGVSTWNPQPVVPPPINYPIHLKYQNARLYEQLSHATNGFTINICKVVGYGAQRLEPGHRGLNGGDGIGGLNGGGEGDRDAEGKAETPVNGNGNGSGGGQGLGINGNGNLSTANGMAQAAARKASSFNMVLPPQRRPSAGRQ